MPQTDASSGPISGPYRRGKLLRSVVPYAKRLRNVAIPGPRLKQYDPVSNLVTEENRVRSAAFPVIEVHTHLGTWLTPDGTWMAPDVQRLLATMDELNLFMLVNLDGRWGEELEANLDRYDRAYPGRFTTFCQLDLDVLDGRGGPDDLVRSLEQSAAAGAKGLKIWKNLGLMATVSGRRILPDDPLLAPVWEAAGALGLPVLTHVADPVAFFQPIDRTNERLEELLAHPSISLSSHGPAVRQQIMTSFEAMIAQHPATQFIGAHVGCFAENLGWVSRMLDDYPNFWIDTAARADLGRQPRAAARLMERHQDRILFGADVFPIDPEVYRVYFRLFETEDEYFRYRPDPGPSNEQGRWNVYGLGLAPEVLQKLYNLNAARLLSCDPPPGPRSDA
jgi:predicted TIM-barrel fold metal-dependent hydrolase